MKTFPHFFWIVLFFWFCWSISVSALTDSEVFIQNAGGLVTDHPVHVPLSFSDGEKTPDQISGIQLQSGTGNLITQADATSFYKSGYVKTAVAKVLVTLNPNQEKIFTIGTYSGSPPSFVMDSRVNSFLTNGKMKVEVHDIKGGLYTTFVDVDSPSYSGNVTLVRNGPVEKTWRIVKRHDPATGSEELTHLFSSVFLITAYSGKPYVTVDHFLVNSNNLDEDPEPQPTGGFNNGYLYENPNYGAIFYTDAKIVVDTPGDAHTTYLMDESFIFPTAINEVETTSTHTELVIMPANGQQLLKDTHNEGPSLAQQSNFIGSGQGFLTRFVITFGVPFVQHPIEEYVINSGQTLSRWNKISGYFFSEVPNPLKVNPSLDVKGLATSQYTTIYTDTINGNKGYRFSPNLLNKDLRSGGYYDYYQAEPPQLVAYLYSCQDHCQKRAVDAMRFQMYSETYGSNYVVGYSTIKNPKALPNAYAAPLIEGVGTGPTSPTKCGQTYNAPDILGFCHPTKGTPLSHRIDAYGQNIWDYAQASGQNPYHHGWNAWETAHFSNGVLWYRYMLTDDQMAWYIGDAKAQTGSLSFYWFWKNGGGVTGGSSQGRSDGRSLKQASMAYSLTLNPEYKQIASAVLDWIDLARNKGEEGSQGVNPYTGENFPVKYFPSLVGTYEYNTLHPFHHYLVMMGIAAAGEDVFRTTDAQYATIRQYVQDGLYFVYHYLYKNPTAVRNGILYNDYPLNEGKGFDSDYYMFVYKAATSTQGEKYTLFDGEKGSDSQEQIGLCPTLALAESIRKTDPSFIPEYDQYFQDFAESFQAIHNQRTRTSEKGIQIQSLNDDEVCGITYFMGVPNAANQGFLNGYFSTNYTPSCTDADGDGVTTCAGDCHDGNPNINPNVAESCNNGTDDNCNLLTDCQDIGCGTYHWATSSWVIDSASCSGKPYCGNSVLDSGETCDVVPLQSYGTAINPIPPYTCVPAFTSFYQGCQYSSSATFYLGQVIPSEFGVGKTASLTLKGVGFTPSATVKIGSLTLTPVFVDSTTLTVNLSISQTNSLGIGTHFVQVTQSGQNSNAVPVQGVDQTLALTSLSPTTIAYEIGTTLTLNGSNFTATDQVDIDGKVLALSSFVNSTQVKAGLSASFQQQLGLGTHNVRIKQGTEYSNSLPVLFADISPTLNAITPNNIESDTASLLAFTGTNFKMSAKVHIGSLGDITPLWVTSGQLTYTLSLNQINSLGNGQHEVYVIHPNGMKSGSLFLQINDPLPNAPSNLTATIQGGIVTLIWNDNADDEIEYIVERSTDNFNWSIIKNGLPPGTITYADGTVQQGTYYYRIAARSVIGLSPYSNVASITIGGSTNIEPNVGSLTTNTAFDSVSLGQKATLQLIIQKLHSAGEGYTHSRSMIFGVFCRIDHPDPQRAFHCQELDDFWKMAEVFYLSPDPFVLGSFFNARTYNYNSIYPQPLLPVTSVEKGIDIPEGTTSLAITVEPTALNLSKGTYRFIGSLFPIIYDFSGGNSNIVETDITDNFVLLNFEVTSPDSGNEDDDDEDDFDYSDSGEGDGGNGGGDGDSGSGNSGGGGDNPSLSCVPSIELCNGIDDDCDLEIDEGCIVQSLSPCENGQYDRGELGIDCGGVCSQSCYLPIPESTSLFFIAALNPLILLFQFFLRLIGF
ncbi:MAG: IPT/TIG domain-containing protein [Candidatus Diapherotrites archaeon]